MPPSKKPSLSAALHEASGKKTTPAPTPLILQKDSAEPAPSTERPPSRKGKKIISGYFDPAVARQLKQLALDQDSTVQALLSEALNDLFEKYQKKPIA